METYFNSQHTPKFPIGMGLETVLPLVMFCSPMGFTRMPILAAWLSNLLALSETIAVLSEHVPYPEW